MFHYFPYHRQEMRNFNMAFIYYVAILIFGKLS